MHSNPLSFTFPRNFQGWRERERERERERRKREKERVVLFPRDRWSTMSSGRVTPAPLNGQRRRRRWRRPRVDARRGGGGADCPDPQSPATAFAITAADPSSVNNDGLRSLASDRCSAPAVDCQHTAAGGQSIKPARFPGIGRSAAKISDKTKQKKVPPVRDRIDDFGREGAVSLFFFRFFLSFFTHLWVTRV